jgi:hypothetical protein
MRAVLEFLAEGARSTVDATRAVMSSPYGASYGQMERTRVAYVEQRVRAQESAREYRQYWNTLSHLKRSGLVVAKESPRGRMLILTTRGAQRLAQLRESAHLSCSPLRYRSVKSEKVRIVAFDIPERYRTKRAWMRDALRHLGLAMIQESVWVGKVVLPEEFLEDLRVLKLTPYVQVCGVTEQGTMVHLVR